MNPTNLRALKIYNDVFCFGDEMKNEDIEWIRFRDPRNIDLKDSLLFLIGDFNLFEIYYTNKESQREILINNYIKMLYSRNFGLTNVRN